MAIEEILLEIRNELRALNGRVTNLAPSASIYHELLTKQQAAEYAKTSPRTIDRWTAMGDLMPVKKAGAKRPLFRRADLDALLQTSAVS